MENKDILKILYENLGEFVSGETLAKHFNISRAAMSKRMAKLKSLGVDIEAVTNKGYKLKAIPDDLQEESIALGVQDEQEMGKEILLFEEIDSTNDYMKKIAKSHDTGAVVISKVQTGGKGRRGRSFLSLNGGLYFSILVKPQIVLEKIPFLTQVVAASVYKALEKQGVKSQIKWPNDIILGGKKVCGILCEMSCEMDYLNHVVIGIGVNVEEESFEGELQEVATSLKEQGFPLKKLEVFWEILRTFEEYYQKFLQEDYKEIVTLLKENSYILGKDIYVINGRKMKNARAIDIDQQGLLWVRYEEGNEEGLNYGEISIRRR